MLLSKGGGVLGQAVVLVDCGDGGPEHRAQGVGCAVAVGEGGAGCVGAQNEQHCVLEPGRLEDLGEGVKQWEQRR